MYQIILNEKIVKEFDNLQEMQAEMYDTLFFNCKNEDVEEFLNECCEETALVGIGSVPTGTLIMQYLFGIHDLVYWEEYKRDYVDCLFDGLKEELEETGKAEYNEWKFIKA